MLEYLHYLYTIDHKNNVESCRKPMAFKRLAVYICLLCPYKNALARASKTLFLVRCILCGGAVGAGDVGDDTNGLAIARTALNDLSAVGTLPTADKSLSLCCFFGAENRQHFAVSFFQPPDMLICPEKQAHGDAHEPKDGKEKCRAAAFSGAEHLRKQALCLRSHNGFKDLIHQKPAQKVTHGNCEKLEGIPGGEDPALDLDRNIQPVHGLQIGIHGRNDDPTQHRANAPRPNISAEGEEEVFRTHGDH